MPHIDSPDVYIVANRLSQSVKKSESGKYEFKPSSGGLVGAIQGISGANRFKWYGWPGVSIDEEDQPEITKRLAEYGSVPIYVEQTLCDKHYNGFANKIMWPLLHYHLHEIHLSQEDWAAYQRVNRMFAERLAEDMSDGDVAWIQDYHLMLLPSMLREELQKRGKDAKIGFFLHTPFPSSDFFRILPVKRDILLGLLECELIGFHTVDYQEHFIRACQKILGLHATDNVIQYKSRLVKTLAIAIGINPKEYADSLKSESVQKRVKELRARYADDKKLIVSVDRLDYIKGIPQRLDAVEEFLKRYPDYVEKFALLQVVVPSREDIEGYQRMHEEIDLKVARINSRIGSIEVQPIHSLFSTVTHDELAGLYAASDACIVSSTRDGMNIVSMEYIACQQERHGTMIISEFAGAADVLDGCIKFNPWDVDEFAEAIHKGLSMSECERSERQGKLYRYISKHTSQKWGQDFLNALLDA